MRVDNGAKPRTHLQIEDHVILYVDESSASRKARTMLRDVGLDPFITDGPVEMLQHKPLVIFRGGIFQGVEQIQGLIRLLVFWQKSGKVFTRT